MEPRHGPPQAKHWDRKTLSMENWLTAAGVSIDPGNFVYATMMFAIHLALGMDMPVPIDPTQKATDIDDLPPVSWPRDWRRCFGHPLLTADVSAGITRKKGRSVPVACLLYPPRARSGGVAPPVALRLVLASLVHSEGGHRICLRDPEQAVSPAAQERMGDVLEAIGGLLAPFSTQTKAIMQDMRDKHRINGDMIADAFKDFTAFLVQITELSRMLYKAKETFRSNIIRILGHLEPAGLVLPMEPRTRNGRLPYCWICAELRAVHAGHLINRGADGRYEDDLGATDPKGLPDTPEDLSTAIMAKRRRAPEPGNLRIPPSVTDGRFIDASYYDQHCCDHCGCRFLGAYRGQFQPPARNVPLHQLAELWEAGEIDASWFCVDCWVEDFRERNPRIKITIDEARVHLGLPPARRPADLPDDRFNYEKRGRWCRCDVCNRFCPAKARDHQPGSFVYGANNEVAGPGTNRAVCFPHASIRSEKWTTGQWDATYACRTCLPRFWRRTQQDIDEWLAFFHQGARDHHRIQEAAAQRAQEVSRSRSSWQDSQQGRGSDQGKHGSR